MCGRYAQGRAIVELLSRYEHLEADLFESGPPLGPCFNVAPSMAAPVVFVEDGAVWLGPVQWGLVPRWAKSLDGLKMRPINARSETAPEKPMFRDAFRSGRCLVPAMGFFEWQGKKAPKQPWYIHATDQPLFSFAGLCARWTAPDGGGDLRTFTILTTEANDVVKPIHDRMPCILHKDDEAAWLSGAPADECRALLRPYPAESTAAHRVSKAVNKPGTDGAELIETADDPPASENPGSWLF